MRKVSEFPELFRHSALKFGCAIEISARTRYFQSEGAAFLLTTRTDVALVEATGPAFNGANFSADLSLDG